VAALLALTQCAALGCENNGESIARDSVMSASLAQVAAPRATNDQPSPDKPLPGMGIIEDPPPAPAPAPTPAPTVVTPPKHPYPVKGGMKAVHPLPPVPTSVAAPGGLEMVHPPPPPIAPTAKPPKLGGDMPAVETT
jgi:hypothetical protein